MRSSAWRLTWRSAAALGPRLQLSRRHARPSRRRDHRGGSRRGARRRRAGRSADSWDEFKNPVSPTSGAARFDSASGSGRYQFWETAIDATETEPLVGIGPGTYEYFWAREGSLPTFIRDAHSLYLETAAELGIVGLILILAFVATPFVAGVRRAARRVAPKSARWIAAALAGCAAFAVAAAIDWAWELTVLPVAFLLLVAGIVGRPGEPAAGKTPRLALGWPGGGRHSRHRDPDGERGRDPRQQGGGAGPGPPRRA